MKNETCYLCGCREFALLDWKTRDLPEIKILQCRSCRLVFLESFDHISENYYQDSSMRQSEAMKGRQACLQEVWQDDTRRAGYLRETAVNKSVLDFGCGAGGVLSQIKSFTSFCAGLEPELAMNHAVTEQEGIKVYASLEEIDVTFDVITLFHVLEHIKDPVAVLTKLKKYLKPGGNMMIEVPSSGDALLNLYQSKSFSEFYWSPHLFYFNAETLRRVVEKSGLRLDAVKQVQRYPLSNHMHWLSRGKPGGHQTWAFLDSKPLKEAYEAQLAKIGACDTLLASLTNASSC